MIVRYIIGLGLGAVVTFGLFYLMQYLIESDENPLNEADRVQITEFVPVREEEQVRSKREKPEPPPPPDQPPPDQPEPELDTNVEGMGIDVGSVGMDSQVDIDSQGGFSSDGEYLPIVKVQPVYPRRALTRGIEGYVLLEFTVTKSGSVENPRVVEAEPRGIFDRAAKQAALKFKYKPKVVNGEPIDVHGVQNLIRFELED